LYCKPVNPNATAQDFINSWNCTPDPGCRSLTAEWQLYRDYYLKIKSKYVRLAKLQYDPACENCFIGPNPLHVDGCDDTWDAVSCPTPDGFEGNYSTYQTCLRSGIMLVTL
jgi:hypothetical protein